MMLEAAANSAEDARIQRVTSAQWHEDLVVLAHEIVGRHRNPFHHVSKATFDEAVATLDRRIPTLRGYQVVVGLQGILATIGDGHTRLETSRIYRQFPLEVAWFGHELRVIRTISAHERMLGTRIVGIGESDLEVVLERLGRLIPQAENEWFALHNSARQIVRAEPLAALGIVTEPGTAVFSCEADDSARFVRELESAPHDARQDWVELWPQPPLHVHRPDAPLWSTFLPDKRTVYASFRRYDDLSDNSRMLWESVDNNPVDRLVIDMRHNGGGNYIHGREYLVYEAQRRPSVNRTGRLFIITGQATFSAAMTNATDFRRETEALLVGEPPGARPNGYQELSRFTLPNSKLEASCSMLRYRFQDEDAAPFVMPDKWIDPDWSSYKAGQDAVMEWILQTPRPDS
jgi:Peptidase family S41